MLSGNVETGWLFTKFFLRYRSTHSRKKTNKLCLFFAKQRSTWYPTNNCSLMSHFNKQNTEGKNCVSRTKYKKLLELCFLFKDQELTIMLFGGDGTRCLARNTSGDFKKEKPSPFWKKLLCQSQSSKPEPEPEKAKSIPFMA